MKNSKIKGLMAEYGETQLSMSRKLNLSLRSFNLKINGKRAFTETEVKEITKYFSIRSSELEDQA